MATAIEAQSLLKSIGAELQASGRVGKILRSLVKLIVSSGSVNPQFLVAQRANSTQAGVGVLTTLILNAVGLNNGISYDTTQGLAHLTPGKTYRLFAHGEFLNFSDGATGEIDVQFVDGSNAVLNSNGLDCVKGVWVPSTSTGGSSGHNSVETYYTVPAGVSPSSDQATVKLRCTGATGTADLPSGKWIWTIQEVPG